MTVATAAERLHNRATASPTHIEAIRAGAAKVKHALAVAKIRGHGDYTDVVALLATAERTAHECHASLPQHLESLAGALKRLTRLDTQIKDAGQWQIYDVHRSSVALAVQLCSNLVPELRKIRIIADEYDIKITPSRTEPRKKSNAPRPQAKIASQAARFKNYRR